MQIDEAAAPFPVTRSAEQWREWAIVTAWGHAVDALSPADLHQCSDEGLQNTIFRAAHRERPEPDIRTLAECGRRCAQNAAEHLASSESLVRSVRAATDPERRALDRVAMWKEAGAAEALGYMGEHFTREARQLLDARMAHRDPVPWSDVVERIAAKIGIFLSEEPDIVGQRAESLRWGGGPGDFYVLAAIAFDPVVQLGVCRAVGIASTSPANALLQRCSACWDGGVEDPQLCADIRSFLHGPERHSSLGQQLAVAERLASNPELCAPADAVPPPQSSDSRFVVYRCEPCDRTREVDQYCSICQEVMTVRVLPHARGEREALRKAFDDAESALPDGSLAYGILSSAFRGVVAQLDKQSSDSHADFEIIPEYRGPHASPETATRLVVRHKFGLFLRHSKGPRQGHFFDTYGDDYLSRDLAEEAIAMVLHCGTCDQDGWWPVEPGRCEKRPTRFARKSGGSDAAAEV